jgi:hypothetical protein
MEWQCIGLHSVEESPPMSC